MYNENDIFLIWNRVVKEIRDFQELQGANRGLIKNPILNVYYFRETAFSAKIFAVHYILTQEDEYLERAKLAYEAVSKHLENSIEFDEPVWKPRGISFRKGSLPATVMLFEALLEAKDILAHVGFFKLKFDQIKDYIKSCYLKSGMFTHDKVYNRTTSKVINTSAMALYLMGKINSMFAHKLFEERFINLTHIAISNSQRKDGLWPYIFPNSFQKVFYYVWSLIKSQKFKKLNLKVFRDSSIFFGDGLHHTITLLYLIKFYETIGSILSIKALERGLKFIEKNFILEEDFIRFNFNWEPKPSAPRYGNFIDSTTYFVIIDIFHRLSKFNFIERKYAEERITKICRYIVRHLLRNNEVPCIEPYDGPKEVVENIYPRPAESVVHKGFLISEIILKEFENAKE